MASLNKVFIIGNLGQDPELRYTPSQAAVANFSVATTESRTDKEGKRQDITEWHRIVVWNKQAENCAKYLSKGRPVFIEGKLQTRSWEDKNGQKRYTTEIVANLVQFLGSPQAAREIDQSRAGADQGGFNMGDAPSGSMNLGGGDMAGLDDIPF
jgi:single-strand DNA-binding protein